MNKILATISIITILFPGLLMAQNVSLTFRVDMSKENVSPDGVHVAGNFQSDAGFGANWNPSGSQLTDPDGDKIYELTVMVPQGVYLYKFVNGDEWSEKPELPSGDCAKNDGGGNFNREVIVGNGGINLPPVFFDSCNATLKLAVNMSQEQVSAAGIHVMGDFQTSAGYASNWDPSSIKLTDENNDGTYEVSLSVLPGSYSYVFVNGNTSGEMEMLGGPCATDDGNSNWYRPISASNGLNEADIYCFGTCTLCDPSITTNFDTYWWNEAVFYEIFVRSFYDSDGDGIGDFQGIIQKLDYLNDGDPTTDDDLGITGIWLMPMMESPSYHGYDVTNYYATEPDYGSMADFEELLDSCHARGIKVIIDFVMNHSSSQHPWFTQSASNQNNYRDWYIWSSNNPGFQGPWGQTVWHPNGGDYYYGLFWGGMPDLNYSNQAVKDEMFNITKFWLDKGIDGFRLDAIKYLDEDGTVLENTPETFTLLEEFNQLYKSRNQDAFTVGEVWSNTSSIIPYTQNNRLDVCFDFDMAYSMINAVNSGTPDQIRNQIDVIQDGYRKLQYATFLTNHDIDRIFSQFGQDESKMKLAASIYLALPGIPFIYYGEELGMTGTGAHENIRRPMQWSNGTHAGFSTSSPWFGVGNNYQTRNVTSLEANPNSLLNHYKKWIHIRNNHTPLTKGYLLDLELSLPSAALGFARIHDDEAVLFIANMANGSSASPSISLSLSSLEPGTYAVQDLISGQLVDSMIINQSGGFSNWSFSGGLAARESRAYFISKQIALNNEKVKLARLPLKISPNPNSGIFKISLPEGEKFHTKLKVMGISGAVLHQQGLRAQEPIVDLSHLPKGIYLLEVSSGDRRYIQKVEIQP
ncbi:MAG: alpha-amylase family glycosyl hydrolase [Bacteroidia bacterium]|nr:alpha-amylase family glycosyl hydrolase [Bacteroidia bacterium]